MSRLIIVISSNSMTSLISIIIRSCKNGSFDAHSNQCFNDLCFTKKVFVNFLKKLLKLNLHLYTHLSEKPIHHYEFITYWTILFSRPKFEVSDIHLCKE